MFYEMHHLGSPDYMRVETGNDFSYLPHLHQCFEIIIVLNGEMKVTVDDKEYILHKKEALMIFPNQIHALYSEHNEHVLSIFSPKLVQAYSAKVSGKLPVNGLFMADDYLIEQLKGVDRSSSIAEKKGIMYMLCARFDSGAEYRKSPSYSGNLLYKVFSFVEENFSSECKLLDLAMGIGYEYSYLSRSFKKATGLSFNNYVNIRRLTEVCYLLENTDMPVVRCALECGYTSLRSFNRIFKEHYGITPTKYRENYVKKEKE